MKKVLVLQFARFGDLVQTKRLILSLEQKYEVHLCTDTFFADIVTMVYPKVIPHYIPVHGYATPNFSKLTSLFKTLQDENFEYIYNLNFSPLNSTVAELFPPQKVLGYWKKSQNEYIDSWTELNFRLIKARQYNFNLADFWAGYAENLYPAHLVNPIAQAKGDVLGVVLSGREARRSLSREQLVDIIKFYYKKTNAQQISLFGTGLERPMGEDIISALPDSLREKTINYAGRTNFATLAEYLNKCCHLLSPDTGTMHLAAHLGVPTTAFFFASAWIFETGPYGEGHTVYQMAPPCAPCIEAVPCPNKLICQKPFELKEFLRYVLTEKKEHLPSYLRKYTSSFDSLGLYWNCLTENDSDKTLRDALRKNIAGLLGKEFPLITPEEHLQMKRFFSMRDYIQTPYKGLINEHNK